MTRSTLLIGIAFAGAVVACEDGHLPRSPLVPPPKQPGFVMGYVTEPGAVAVAAVQVTVADGAFKGKTTVTDVNGLYQIGDVDGEFGLTFQKPGYATTTIQVRTGIVQINAEIVPLTPETDVSGNWRARFKPSPVCGQIAGAGAVAAIDFVEYDATISQHGARLEITLS